MRLYSFESGSYIVWKEIKKLKKVRDLGMPLLAVDPVEPS